MKISLNWLGRYVDLRGLDPARIAEDLTLSTAEIEGVHRLGAGLEMVVVGEVLSCRPHPDSDHLHLCTVACGSPEPLPVVCGAANVAQGQKIAFARVGVTLPGGLVLKKTKIRGAVSEGMILSEQELGLAESSEGILVLDPAWPVGGSLPEFLPVQDTVLEIDNKSITHRPDLWGHYGFARELAALHARPLLPAHGPVTLPPEGRQMPIRIEAERLCSRYVGTLLEGLQIGPSPAWMRYLLVAVGQRPISNIVDLTNFLLLDLGQPMHAFDLSRLSGPEIRIRLASHGERLRTLDGQERPLSASDLVIADASGPVALAGVMGGAATEIGPETTSMLLESATFDAVSVRRSATRHALRTEASARFEKSLDPTLAMTATTKFLALLPEVCPAARVAGPPLDAGGWSFTAPRVSLRRQRVALKLGIEIPDERIEETLHCLHFGLERQKDGWSVEVPSFRATKDISIEDDLIEEIGRLFRYGNIPGRPFRAPVEPPWRDPRLFLERRLRSMLALEARFFEAYHYSFLPDALAETLGLEAEPYLRLRNPIAENLSRIRRDVLPCLFTSLELDLRQRPEVRLFEIGKGYRPEQRGERGQPLEVRQAAGLLGRREGEEPFAEVKGILEHILERLDLQGVHCFAPEAPPPYLHPTRCLALGLGETFLGLFGSVHPGTLRALGVQAKVACFSLDLGALLGLEPAERKYQPLPTYPPILVDLALAVPEHARAGEIGQALALASKGLARSVELFDVYRGGSLGAGRKSLAFHVTLLAPDRTLGDEDEKKFLDRVRRILPQIGAELRG